MIPTQLSVVVGAVGVDEHSSVISANVGVAGLVTSSPVMITSQVAVFPLPSSTVIVTVCVLPSPEANALPIVGN